MLTSVATTEPASVVFPAATRSTRRRESSAGRKSSSGSVLRLAILIADPAGDILYWNAEAQQALARVLGSRPIDGLRDVFSPEVLEKLQSRGTWVEVEAPGAPDVAFRVRLRRLFDSGQSMLLFFAVNPS